MWGTGKTPSSQTFDSVRSRVCLQLLSSESEIAMTGWPVCFMQPVTKPPASHETTSLAHKDFLTVQWTLSDCCAHLCCVNPPDVLLLLFSLHSCIFFSPFFFSCSSESSFSNVTSCLCDAHWCGSQHKHELGHLHRPGMVLFKTFRANLFVHTFFIFKIKHLDVPCVRVGLF